MSGLLDTSKKRLETVAVCVRAHDDNSLSIEKADSAYVLPQHAQLDQNEEEED